MLVAELDKWVTVEKSTRSKGSIGTPQDDYAEIFSTWAGISYGAGSMAGDNSGENVRTDAVITLRYYPEINYKCRILYESQYYKIVHKEVIGRREGLRLRCIMWEDEV